MVWGLRGLAARGTWLIRYERACTVARSRPRGGGEWVVVGEDQADVAQDAEMTGLVLTLAIRTLRLLAREQAWGEQARVEQARGERTRGERERRH